MNLPAYCEDIARRAKAASRLLATVLGRQKDRWLLETAQALEARTPEILDANRRDIAAAEKDQLNSAMIDRLRFTPDRKVEVMESSTGGCNGRVCRNVYPLASLLARGFKPVRFNALQDQTVVAAAAFNDDKSAGNKGALHSPPARPPAQAGEGERAEPRVRHHKKHR